MKTALCIMVSLYFFYAATCEQASKSPDKTITVVVSHYRVPCFGAGLQLCYLIKKNNQSEWEFLYEGIEGFQYEWGKVYELAVEEIQRKNVMSDQSPVTYKLIRVVSKTDFPANQTFPLVVKDTDMTAVRKDANGKLSLLGQYPIRCSSDALCEELEKELQSQQKVICFFQHAEDKRSLILQSIEN